MRKVIADAAMLLAAVQLRAQAAATVCSDGSTSTAAGRGACSGHGGVDAKATKAAEKAAKATKKAEKKVEKADAAESKAAATQVTCTDGTTSAGGRGACSAHGGIAKSNPVEKKAEVVEAKANQAKAQAKVATGTASKETQAASKRGEDNDPTGAIAQCKDGMYSHAANRRGACSGHKGVAKWM